MKAERDLRWPKNLRLRRREDFRRVYECGRRQASPAVVTVWIPSGKSQTRVGLAAARSLGTIVRRNRAKRRLREIVRQHKELLPEGLDVVFIARPALLAIPYRRACQEVALALRRLGEGASCERKKSL